MDRLGRNPFGSLMMMTGMSTALMTLIPLFLIAFGVIYILGRSEGSRTGVRDPYLGAKVVASLMVTVSFQMVLAGVAIGCAMFFRTETVEKIYKTAGPLVLAGMLNSLLPLVAYWSRIHGKGNSNAIRQAIGLNAVVNSLSFSTALTALTYMLLNNTEGLSSALAATAVYFFGTCVCIFPLLATRSSNTLVLPES